MVRVPDLKSGGRVSSPALNIELELFLGRPWFDSLVILTLQLANWSTSRQLGCFLAYNV